MHFYEKVGDIGIPLIIIPQHMLLNDTFDIFVRQGCGHRSYATFLLPAIGNGVCTGLISCHVSNVDIIVVIVVVVVIVIIVIIDVINYKRNVQK